MLRCHFTIKPLFWDTFIQGTPSFKSHIVPPAPPNQVHIIFYQLPLLNGHLYLGDICPGPKVIPRLEDPLCYVCISYLCWRDSSIQGTLALVPSVSPEWRLHCAMNGPFPSSPGPLYQNEVKCSAFDMEMFFILMQIKLIFTWKVVHLVSFWKWGFLELGVFVGERKVGMLCEK